MHTNIMFWVPGIIDKQNKTTMKLVFEQVTFWKAGEKYQVEV